MEVSKGIGDAVDSFIGAQGLEMAGVPGAVSKAIQASGKLAPVLGGAMQAYFDVEGTILAADGVGKIVDPETKEDVRAGGSEVGMGAIMVGGAVGSVRSGVRGRKTKQEQSQFDNTVKEVANINIRKFLRGLLSIRLRTENRCLLKRRLTKFSLIAKRQ